MLASLKHQCQRTNLSSRQHSEHEVIGKAIHAHLETLYNT
jgi:hypothetical protein